MYSRPDYFNAYGNGIGLVPRRSWDMRTTEYIRQVSLSPLLSLQGWAQQAPLRLLAVLIATHPMAQMALSNDLDIAFSPGDTRIVAVENGADKTANDEGTAVLDALWERLDPAMGGMTGLQRICATQFTVAGIAAVEAIAGPRGEGIASIVDFSPLTIRFRDTPGKAGVPRVIEQQQNGGKAAWVELPPAACRVVPWSGSYENPYGVPRFSSFLTEGLADASEQGNLKDIFRAIAYPHIAFEFPVTETALLGAGNPMLLAGKATDEYGNPRDLEPIEYAFQIYAEFMKILPTLKADDFITLPAGAKANVINAGAGLGGLDSSQERRLLRICQSLDHPPSLLGITFGGTQAYSATQYRVYTQKLETLRALVNAILVWIANRELQLRGIPLIARADTEVIQSEDKLLDAQADQARQDATFELVRAGLLLPEDASQRLVGSGVADPAKAQEYFSSQGSALLSPPSLPSPQTAVTETQKQTTPIVPPA